MTSGLREGVAALHGDAKEQVDHPRRRLVGEQHPGRVDLPEVVRDLALRTDPPAASPRRLRRHQMSPERLTCLGNDPSQINPGETQ
jgi:hypothetical protein